MEGSTGRKLICIVLMGIGLVILLINLIFYEMESKIDSKFPTTMKMKVLKGFDEGIELISVGGELYKSNSFTIYKNNFEFEGKVINVNSEDLIELVKSSSGFDSVKEYVTETEESLVIKTPRNVRIAISINEKEMVKGLSKMYLYCIFLSFIPIFTGAGLWMFWQPRGWETGWNRW